MRVFSIAVTVAAAMSFAGSAMAVCDSKSHTVKAPQEVVKTTPASTATDKKG